MKFLLDTNVLIPAEPTAPEYVEPETRVIVELLRVAQQGSHGLYVHAASIEELLKDRTAARRELRTVLLQKYQSLDDASPSKRVELAAHIGTPKPGSHDENDLRLLASLASDAIDYLVTK